VDKAQGSRPPDKAFPGDPKLLERGLPEQQVTLVGCAREGRLGKEGWNLGGGVFLTKPWRETDEDGAKNA
jgi:hypothetical protein